MRISGTVEDVVYRNEDNDYAVIDVVLSDATLITAVGCMPYVCEGESVVLEGEYTTHKEFGKQFSVTKYEKSLPTTLTAILKYLTSSQIKGIGSATALKIVNKYGEDTFDVIEHHPEWLTEISGITAKKAATIAKSFCEMSEAREVMMFFSSFVGTSLSNKIYKLYGSGAVGIVKDNPYRLCKDIVGIGFAKADEIASKIGIDKHSPVRIEGAVRYLLTKALTGSGHTYLPRQMLINGVSEEIEVDGDEVSLAIDDMISAGELIITNIGEQPSIYLKHAYTAEKFVAEKLLRLDSSTDTFSHKDIGIMTERIEAQHGIEYGVMQRRAIFEALSGGVLIITGGPGTGKTTVVRALIQICQSVGLKTALAAPTGRAAKRLSEATLENTKTIHRLLEMEHLDGMLMPRFNRNEYNPLDENVIIIDEASMIDIFLCESLLRAAKNGTRIIFIGDFDQLPSVGAGNFLHDVINSGRFTTVELDEVYRQSSESMIIDNAHRVNRGEMPIIDVKDKDFFFLPREEWDIADTVISLISTRLPKKYGEHMRSEAQVITPSRRGNVGTDSLNVKLQEALNPPSREKREVQAAGKLFRVGDRVMQVRNNYDIVWTRDGVEDNGIFNGDIGVIEEIDAKGNLKIRFDDNRICDYEKNMLEDLDLSYAITVHKSQGSEYHCVIVPLYSAPPMLLTRNLIYTAITRAKSMVILVGNREILSRMVANDYQALRYTHLCDFLTDKKKY